MRAFVIGNGPSLNDTPLNKLRDEFTIGMNRFDLLGLDWDPNLWIMADVHSGDDWWDWPDLLSRKSLFFFRDHDREWLEPLQQRQIGIGNVIYMPRCEHIGGDYIPTEWHLPSPCEYGGGASIALQAAAALGHNPIYLVGCDLYRYRGPNDPDINHFDPDYCPYKTKRGKELITPKRWAELNRRLTIAHEVAKRSAAEMGISIINATVGGMLEVYERANIHEVLDGKA